MSNSIDYIIGALVMLLGIAISIALHELGHLLPAKKFGVRVARFMVGFGPTLFSRKRGETEYGIKLIPLGGYVSLLGMQPTADEYADRDDSGKSLAARYRRYVERYRGPSELEAEENHRAFYKLPAGKRLVIMFGGPVANLILGLVFSAIALFAIGVMTPSNQVASVVECVGATSDQACDGQPKTIAAENGIARGDRILSIGGSSVSDATAVRALLKNSVGSTIDIKVSHNGVVRDIAAKIENQRVYDPSTNQFEVRPFLGVVFDYERKPVAFGAYATFATNTLAQTFEMIGQLPTQAVHAVGAILGTEQRQSNGAVSVVGVTKVAGDIAIQSNGDWLGTIGMWLLTLASLNFALFAFNMIPVLPLDGGHILAAIYGKVKELWFRMTGQGKPRPVDLAMLGPVTMIGWTALTLMGLLFVIADIVAPIHV